MSRKRLLGAFVSRARLRAAFLLLGAILLLGLLFLSLAARERLREAQADREEMVASRVFDELEREVSAFLDGEAARPRYHSLASTDPASWAPFVVGYFKTDHGAEEIVAADGITSENKRRIRWALEQARPEFVGDRAAASALAPGALPAAGEEHEAPQKETGQAAPAPVSPASPHRERQQKPSAKSEGSLALESKGNASGAEIIQQLNRAPELRKSKKSADEQAAPGEAEDPFQDYRSAF